MHPRFSVGIFLGIALGITLMSSILVRSETVTNKKDAGVEYIMQEMVITSTVGKIHNYVRKGLMIE